MAFETAESFLNIVEVDFNAAEEIPGFGVLAAFAVLEATLGPDDGAEAITIDDVIMLDGAGEAHSDRRATVFLSHFRIFLGLWRRWTWRLRGRIFAR